MKEFTIYMLNHNATIGINNGSFRTFESAKCKLYEILATKDNLNMPYYVDNDFYYNKHANVNCKWFTYFCIKEREVTEWKKYTICENNYYTKEKRNVINFIDFLN